MQLFPTVLQIYTALIFGKVVWGSVQPLIPENPSRNNCNSQRSRSAKNAFPTSQLKMLPRIPIYFRERALFLTSRISRNSRNPVFPLVCFGFFKLCFWIFEILGLKIEIRPLFFIFPLPKYPLKYS